MTRPGWDEYYLGVAKAFAARGECSRRQVGAIIVKDHAVVSEGYNGAPPGQPSCLEGHCPRARSNATPLKDYAETGCVVIHAEVNALLRASWTQMQGATMYVTCKPCELCAPIIQAAGIARVVYPPYDE